MTRRVPVVPGSGPGEGWFPIGDYVDRDKRKFEYPFPQPQVQRPSLGGGGGSPTIVVAASDATDISKQKADLVCTGTNDEATILEAIDIITTTGVGGRVLLTEGEFSFTADNDSIIQSNQAGLIIEGMGPEATRIVVAGSFGSGDAVFDCSAADVQIRQLRLEDNTADASRHYGIITGIRARVTNVDGWVTGADSVFLWVSGILGNITDCQVEVATLGILVSDDYTTITGTEVFATAEAIRIDGGGVAGPVSIINNVLGVSVAGACVIGTGTHVLVEGNYMEGTAWGVHNEGDSDWIVQGNKLVATNGMFFEVGADNSLIANNRFDSGGQILFDGGSFTGCVVDGNVWDAASTPSIDGVIVFDNGATNCQVINNTIADANGMDGIRIETGTDVVVRGNFINEPDRGVHINAGTRVTVDANVVKFAGEHGIDYAGDDGSVRNNTVYGSSQNTTNTWDNINIAGDANIVTTNTSLPAPSSPLTRYGLNIVSGNDNAVYANALGDSSVYGTADSVDAGTNTQVAPAAGAIGGQFAY